MTPLHPDYNAPRVTVSVGYTRNMGNFESLRVDIGIEDSVRSTENVATCFDRVYKFAEKKLMEKVSEVEAELNSVKGK